MWGKTIKLLADSLLSKNSRPDRFHGSSWKRVVEVHFLKIFQHNRRKMLVCKLQCNVAKFLRINMIKFIKQKLFGIGMVYTFCWNQ